VRCGSLVWALRCAFSVMHAGRRDEPLRVRLHDWAIGNMNHGSAQCGRNSGELGDSWFARPDPPYDIDTMESIEPPWQAIKEWIPDDEPNLNWFNQERDTTGAAPDQFDQSPAWQPEEVPLGDGRTLILEDS
jgi:hypothetical protein